MMMNRNIAVHQEAGKQTVLAERVRLIAIGSKTLADFKTSSTARDHVQQCGGRQSAANRRDDFGLMLFSSIAKTSSRRSPEFGIES